MLSNCTACNSAYDSTELKRGRCEYCRKEAIVLAVALLIVVPILVAFGIAMLETYQR